jgi:hypothetical protein
VSRPGRSGFLELAGGTPFRWVSPGGGPAFEDLETLAACREELGFRPLPVLPGEGLQVDLDPWLWTAPPAGLRGPGHAASLLRRALARAAPPRRPLLLVLASSLGHLAWADRSLGALVLARPLLLAPPPGLAVAPAEGRAVAEALAEAALAQGLRRLGQEPPATEADAELAGLLDLVCAAGPYWPRLEAVLGSPGLLARPLSPARLRWLGQERLLELLASPVPYERERALEAVRRCSDLALLPRLQRRYRCTAAREARQCLVEAHRAIGANACLSRAPGRRRAARHRALEGRLAAVDEAILELLELLAAGRGEHRGVDLAAWRRGLGGRRLVIADLAAGEGTGTLDLLRALDRRRARLRPLSIALVGGDPAADLHLLPLPGEGQAVLDAFGDLLQLQLDGRATAREEWRAGEPAPDPRLRRRIRRAFRQAGGQRRAAWAFRWVNPALLAEIERRPGRVRFLRHDLFQPLHPRVHLVRVFDALCVPRHPGAEPGAHFAAQAVQAGLVSAGCSLAEGGVLVVGSAAEAEGSADGYLDYEIRQRVERPEGPALVLRESVGAGLGVRLGDLPLPQLPGVA